MNLTVEEGLKRLFRYHKFLDKLDNYEYESKNDDLPIYTYPNLPIQFKHNIANMFNIENSHLNNNSRIPFGIINTHSLQTHMDYKYLSILSFLHQNNYHHSNLNNLNTYHINSVSNWSYKIQPINPTNTMDLTLIVAPSQSILNWRNIIKSNNITNIEIVTNYNELNRIDITNYRILIISNNIWNQFAFEFSKYKKYLSRLIIEDIHLFSVIASSNIQFKFVWIITPYLKDLLSRYNKSVIWSFQFRDLCVNTIETEDEFDDILELSRNNNEIMTEDYINSIASNKEIIIHNFSYLFKKYKKWNTNRLYSSPSHIFSHQPYIFSTYYIRKGFFNNLLEGIFNTACTSNLYDNIVNYYIHNDYTYSRHISIDNINCAMDGCEFNSIKTFIETNKKNKELLPYYFDCHKDKSALLIQKKNEYDNLQLRNDLSNYHINSYKRINEQLSNILSCPICYNNIDDKMIITSCCANIFHYECLFECFRTDMTCPMCRIPVLFHKSSIIDSTFENIIKIKIRKEALIDLIKEPYKKILIIDGIHQLNLLEYFISSHTNKSIYSYSDKMKNMEMIEKSKIEDESIYIIMKYSLYKFKCINFNDIDLLIIYDNYIGHILSEMMDQLLYKRTKNLKIIYLQTII